MKTHVYIHKAFTGYVVYSHMDPQLKQWASTSIWMVWGDCE